MADADIYAAREIVLYGTNEHHFYKGIAQPIMQNLAKKKVAGKYSAPLALKAWENWVNVVVTEYRRKFGKHNGYVPFPLDAKTKRLAAGKVMREYSEEFNAIVNVVKAEKAAKEAAKKRTVRKTKA